MTLTDTGVRNAKPGTKPAKLFDERGLFMIVTPTGGKWWRLKYRFGSKEKFAMPSPGRPGVSAALPAQRLRLPSVPPQNRLDCNPTDSLTALCRSCW